MANQEYNLHMSTIRTQLPYLFRAYSPSSDPNLYTLFEQPPCDVSLDGLKSAFADVPDDVEVFSIVRVADDYTVEVNLINGLFSIGGNVVDLTPPGFTPTSKRKLIYFRIVNRHTTYESDMFKVVDQLDEFGKFYIGYEVFGEMRDGDRRWLLKITRTIGVD